MLDFLRAPHSEHVEIRVFVNSQIWIPPDLLVLQEFPSENLAVHKREVNVMIDKHWLHRVEVTGFLYESGYQHVKLVVLYFPEQDVKATRIHEHVIRIAEHDII